MGSVTERWEAMQVKTFTKWCNMHLAKRGKAIESVTTGFKDGVALIALLEVIGEAALPKHNPAPRLRLQMIENVSVALRFIADRGVALASIGPEDIVDGNVKLTLGMIWTVILRFAISDLSEEGLSAKQGLLLWCRKKTQGYHDVDVKDFQDSFKDGLAFCALIHRHRPDLIDFEPLTPENPRDNLNLAFDTAEKHLGIPKLLDTEDMISLPRPDERSVMTYCASLYKVFSVYDKVEMAGHRIAKFINFMQATQTMIIDYEQRARVLRTFIDNMTAEFARDPAVGDYQGVRALIAQFKEYRRSEKAQQFAEQSDLAALLSSIQIKLKSMSRPPYAPPEGLTTQQLEEAMENLTMTERKYRAALNAQMRQILDTLRRAFADPANAFADILNEHKTFLSGPPAEGGDFAAQRQVFEAKRAELVAHEPKLADIQAAEEQCAAANIEENEYSDHTSEDLRASFDQLLKTYDKKIQFLGAQESETEGGISAEKMLEFQQSFDHFDADHNHTLERLEFFACLASLGLTNVDFTGQDPEAERIFQEVSEGTGKVTLDQYIRYISSLCEETYDPAALNESFRIVADGKDFVTAEDLQRAQLTEEQCAYACSTLPRSTISPDGFDYSIWTS